MKKVLFVIPSFNIGGTTVSVRNLISLIDPNKYECSVLALNDNGVLKDTYSDISCIKTCFLLQAISISSWKNESNFIRKIFAAAIRFLKNHSNICKKIIINLGIWITLKNLNFDDVVACQEGLATKVTVYINCHRKIAWVRCDYKRYFHDFLANKKEQVYRNFQHIVCVSEQTTRNFIEIYPEYKEKTICIQNPQNVDYIKELSNLNDNDSLFKTDRFTIVSVGRITPIKRFSFIPKIAYFLIKNGIDFCWYIIGTGDEAEIMMIQNTIKEYGVQHNVKMLGAKSNPHFYISNADLYVCLSSSEACPRVINEAKILNTPVISTNFETVYEYITNGENGIISTIESIERDILDFILDQKKQEKIKKEISYFTFNNQPLMEKIYKIL